MRLDIQGSSIQGEQRASPDTGGSILSVGLGVAGGDIDEVGGFIDGGSRPDAGAEGSIGNEITNQRVGGIGEINTSQSAAHQRAIAERCYADIEVALRQHD